MQQYKYTEATSNKNYAIEVNSNPFDNVNKISSYSVYTCQDQYLWFNQPK